MASFEIDFGPDGGGNIKFVDRSQLNKFLETQIREWDNAFAKSDESYPNALKSVLNDWYSIRNISKQISDNSSNFDIFRQVRTFIENRTLVSTSSLEGQKLIKVLAETNELGFFGAWQFRQGASIGTLQTGSDKGAILYLLLSLGMHPKTQKISESAVKATSSTLNAISQSFTNQLENKIADLDAETNSMVERFVGFLANSQEDVREIKEDYASIRKAQHTEFVELAGSAKTEFDRLTSTFKEKIRLEAPASYWTEKAKNHNFWHVVIGCATIVFGFVFALLVWQSGPTFASHAESIVSIIVDDLPLIKSTIEGQKHLVILRLASIGITAILITTLAIWTLRYLVRMMISENHLKSDAQTRSVMISTYLALIKEQGVLEEHDRYIILTSIFRPPTDGLLKDDGLLPNWFLQVSSSKGNN